jgi:hypothetical protein
MHARPDGSLPPTPRWFNDDQWRLARMNAGMTYTQRHAIDRERQVAVDRLDALDQEAGTFITRRRAALDHAREIHQTLWPPVPSGWARRPPRPDAAPLAPMVNGAEELSGWALRWVVVALLRRHGELQLKELHDLVHLMGYCVGGRQPVKTLADAAGHEHDHGRAIRVRRGVYRPADEIPPGPVWTLPDPGLALMPAWWVGTWAERYQLATPDSTLRGAEARVEVGEDVLDRFETD